MIKQNILVTGGAGYIGSALTEALIEDGHRVVVYDDLSTGQKDKVNPQAEFILGDLLDKETVATVFATHSFTSVIHTAGKKAVGESESKPDKYFTNNLQGTLNLLEAMSRYHVPQLIFSSTASVYQAPVNNEPLKESDTLAPLSVYGQSKLMAEQLITTYARLGLLKKFVILRYFNVAGDAGLNFREEKAENVFPILVRALKEGETFNIFGTDYSTKDGTGVRDYIHLDDLVMAHQQALNYNGQNIFNLGSSHGYSVCELIDAFERESGLTLKTKASPRRAGDPASVLADASLAKAELHWQPTRTLDDMVNSTLAVYGLK